MSIKIKISKKPIEYKKAISLLQSRAEKLSSKCNISELIWVLEHPPIYTGGTSHLDDEILDKSIVHSILRKTFPDYRFSTKSDCEVILPMYEKYGPNFLDMLNGIFAFAIYDSYTGEYFIARDHVGIIPLYIGWDDNDVFFVASELKALEGHCRKIELFPPGHFLQSSKKGFKK